MKELHISLLDANHNSINKELEKLKNMNIKNIHLDVGDTSFIPNITFGIKLLNHILQYDFAFDIHFMMQNPLVILNLLNLDKIKCITIHYEVKNIDKILEKLLEHKINYNIEIGLAIKPSTSEVSNTTLTKIDKLLIMTVEPGFGGQKFIERCVDKIKKFKKLFNGKIGVDGGINGENIIKVIHADYFIIGSHFYKAKNMYQCYEELNKLINHNN